MTRTYQRTPGKFGHTCEMLAHDIWRLATSRYPVVRSDAQQSLDMLLHVFKYSSRVFVPLIETTLLKPESYHQYKGALHAVMLSKHSTTMLEIHDFDVQSKLWIAVLKCYGDESHSSTSVNEANGAHSLEEPQELVNKSKEKTLANGNEAKELTNGDQGVDRDLSNESSINVDSNIKVSDVEDQGDQISKDDSMNISTAEDEGNFKKRKSVIALLQNLYSKVSNNCTTIAITTTLPESVTEIPLKWLEANGLNGESVQGEVPGCQIEGDSNDKFM